MGEIIMRNWDLREFRVQVNLPSRIRQVRVSIRLVITPIQGLPNPIRQVVPLMSLVRSYPPYRSHLHPPSLSFSSTPLPSSQNTKLSHPSLSLHAMIKSWHPVQHCAECSIHQVQQIPKIVCHPFILTIRSWPLNVASASDVPPYRLTATSQLSIRAAKVKSHRHIPTVSS